MNSQVFEAAIAYSKLGMSVIPVAPATKRPLIAWEEFQTRRATEEEIEVWWKKYPHASVGIVTGAISNKVVVDVDTQDASVIAGLQLPITPTVKTSKGWHYYFKHPGFPVSNKAGILEKVDIRGDGGFVVAPPSKHLSGVLYEWSIPMEDVPFAELPAWAAVKRPGWKDIGEASMEGVGQGTRNETAASVVGRLLTEIHPSNWETSAWLALRGWNLQNQPPLPERELRMVYESIKQRESAKHIAPPQTRKMDPQEVSTYQDEDRVVSIQEVMDELGKESNIPLYKSGLGLDDIIGGFEEGELVVISGPTGNGKTALMITLTRNLEEIAKACWFSFEVTYRQLSHKLGMNPPIFYLPRKITSRSIEWVEARILEAKVKYGVKVVFIDHLHFLFNLVKMKNTSLEIGDMVARIKNIAVENNLIIFLVVHPQKKSQEDKSEPHHDDIRDSGLVAQYADTCIMIWRIPNSYSVGDPVRYQKEIGKDDNKAVIRVTKNRRTGAVGKASVFFENGYFRDAHNAMDDPAVNKKWKNNDHPTRAAMYEKPIVEDEPEDLTKIMKFL